MKLIDFINDLNANGKIKKEKGMIKCPNCNSESITIERRPNGYCTCIDCKHRWKNGVVEKETCKKCGSSNLTLKIQGLETDVLKANQVALRCVDCGAWIKWCPKAERHLYIKQKTKQIYIKTDMTEMPKGCADCIKARSSGGTFEVAKLWCAETGKSLVFYARPEWCPLVEMEIEK